jgi:hypothetical protein
MVKAVVSQALFFDSSAHLKRRDAEPQPARQGT